jgi:sodium pump decarboxylase gamma subunit
LAGILGEGVRLMLVGMGVVFVLLTLLVLAVKGMSRLALAVGSPALVPDASAASGVEGGGTELIAVISAAVAAYRRDAR